MTATRDNTKQLRAKLEQEGLTQKEIDRRVAQSKLAKRNMAAAPARPNGQKNKTAKALGTIKENPYLAAILDPEHHPCTGVPDAFSRLVHRSKIIHQQSMVFQAGQSIAMIRPDITDFLRATTATKSVTAIGPDWLEKAGSKILPAGYVYTQLANGTYSNDSIGLRKNWATSGFFTTTTDFYDGTDPIQIGERVDNNGVMWKGIELPAAAVINVNMKWDSITASNMVVRTNYINAAGNLIVGANTFVNNVTTEQTQFLALPVAGLLVAIEVAYVGAVATDVLRDLNLTLAYTTLATDITAIATQPIGNNGEYELLLAAGNGTKVSYRVSALSVWAYYTGALTSNGKIAAGMIQKNALPQSTGITSFEEVSVAPGCYSGPLNKGAYAYWKPTDENDFKFNVVTEDTRPKPYLAVAVVANDADAQNVTLRICAHIEVETVNQVLSPSPSFVDPPLIWDAEQQLATLMTGFENDSHLSKFAKVLNKGLGYFGKMAQAAGGIAAAFGQPELAAPLAGIGAASNAVSSAFG